MSGIQTKNLPLRQSLNELIGHDTQDSTARISLQALSRLIGHNIAREIAATGGAGIFATTNAGVSATDPGDYFAVAGSGDDYLILYRNVSGSAQEIARAPSLEAVGTLIGDATLSSDFNSIEQPGFYRSGFDPADTDNTPEGRGQIGLMHIEGDGGRRYQLAFRSNTEDPTLWVRTRHPSPDSWGSWVRVAFQSAVDALKDGVRESVDAVDAVAHQALGIAGDALASPALPYGEFYSAPEQGAPGYTLLSEDGRALAAWDGDGFQLSQLRAEFHAERGSVAHYALTDETGTIFYAVDQIGQGVIGGGDSGPLPATDQGVGSGQRWLNRLSVSVVPEYQSEYDVPVMTRFPDHRAIYQYLDALQSEHGGYVSSETVGQDADGNDIRAYHFRPDIYQESGLYYDPSGLALPRILLIGLTHGNEPLPAIANLILMDDLCNRWNELPGLDAIRWGCNLTLVPALNPWGFDNQNRFNANGIDLNRNWPTGWTDSNTYHGPSPASEPEVQALSAFMGTHSFHYLIDHHRMYDMDTNQLAVWVGCRGDTTLGIATAAAQQGAAYLRRHVPSAISYNPQARVSYTRDGSLARHTQTLGIDSFLLESAEALGDGSGQRDALRQARANCRVLLDLILERERNRRLQVFDFPLE